MSRTCFTRMISTRTKKRIAELQRRYDYLTQKIAQRSSMPCHAERSERDALLWAIKRLQPKALPEENGMTVNEDHLTNALTIALEGALDPSDLSRSDLEGVRKRFNGLVDTLIKEAREDDGD